MYRSACFALVVLSASSYALFAQDTSSGGTPSETPQRGAGVGGVGAPAEGPTSNQPGSAAQPNSAATPGPGTSGSVGNTPAGATPAR